MTGILPELCRLLIGMIRDLGRWRAGQVGMFREFHRARVFRRLGQSGMFRQVRVLQMFRRVFSVMRHIAVFVRRESLGGGARFWLFSRVDMVKIRDVA